MVFSSRCLARRLGIETAGDVTATRNVEGVVEMMLDATQRYNELLTDERLLGRNASLFPTGKVARIIYKLGAGAMMPKVDASYSRRNRERETSLRSARGGKIGY
jgi:hypothetical protein